MSGLIGDVTGIGAAGQGAGAIATAAANVVDRILDACGYGDPTKKASAEAIALRAQVEAAMAPLQGQIEIAKIEAASPSLFVGGARLAIMWVGAIALFCQYGIGSLVGVGLWAYACVSTGTMQPKPDLGITDLLGMIGPMLGISYLRSQDKAAGVATTRLAAPR